MVNLTKIMDGGPSAAKILMQLALSSLMQLGINLQDIRTLTPLWSPNGQFLLEVQTTDNNLMFLYSNGEVLLAKGEIIEES